MQIFFTERIGGGRPRKIRESHSGRLDDGSQGCRLTRTDQ